MLNAPTPEKNKKRICPFCSDPELGINDKFCSSCGSAVSSVNEESVKETPPDEEEESTKVRKEVEEEAVVVESQGNTIEKVVRVIRILRENMGRVIGTGGARIDEVRNVSGAEVIVSESEEEMNKITISGSEESVSTAVEMIKKLASNRYKQRDSPVKRVSQKRKKPEAYDETAELFGLNPYRKQNRFNGRGGFHKRRGVLQRGSEARFMGVREPQPWERPRWAGACDPGYGGMSMEEYFNSHPEDIDEREIPPWERETGPMNGGGYSRGRGDEYPMEREFSDSPRGWGGQSIGDRRSGFRYSAGGGYRPSRPSRTVRRDETAEMFGIGVSSSREPYRRRGGYRR